MKVESQDIFGDFPVCDASHTWRALKYKYPARNSYVCTCYWLAFINYLIKQELEFQRQFESVMHQVMGAVESNTLDFCAHPKVGQNIKKQPDGALYVRRGSVFQWANLVVPIEVETDAVWLVFSLLLQQTVH